MGLPIENLKPMAKAVPEMMFNAAKIYEDRNKIYGDNYKRFGPALNELMSGVTLRTPDDFNRFGILVQIFAKFSRYCNMFNNGGHKDSLDDISVYAMMLQELDSGARTNKITADIADNFAGVSLPKVTQFGNNPAVEQK